ncbi:MAG: GNAT family N-acetyltransferase [Bacteroidales bacterium]|nr:GNAT family N-acetyltransferase [Bacteroidales bacterium]
MELMIRLATSHDIDEITAIYNRIHQSEQDGYLHTGWLPDVYPVRATASDALERQDLFVCERAGRIAASAIINQIQVPAYARGPWSFPAPDEEVMVLHTLTVDPVLTGQGIGCSFVAFYESYAQRHWCRVLRLDTNAVNTVAVKMYRKLGYHEAGVVPCVFNGIPDVHLVLFEKELPSGQE